MSAEYDRLDDAVKDAVGRVIARIEMYDDAVAYMGPDRGPALQELLTRCRELKRAYDARLSFLLSADKTSEQP